MATFTYFNGNRAFYRVDFRDFAVDEAASSNSLLVLQFKYGQASYDPFATPWRIELDVSGLKSHKVTEGPMAGERVPIAGTITRIRYYDDQDNLLLRGAGLEGSAPMIAALFDLDRGKDAWAVMMQGNHVFNGSDASGVSWQGDEIVTTRGNDTVNGNGGDDFIRDGGGRDAYFGGDGWDTLSYADYWFWDDPAGALTGIRADLAAGTVRGPDKLTDTVSGIEAIRGTHMNDTLLGDDGSNQFMGLGGNDRIDGRGGFDEVRYDRDDRFFGFDGIQANMAKGKVRDGFGNTDRILNIEAIRGTNQRDKIYDDSGHNRLRGEGGNDVLRASGGNDTLRGGEGRDQFVFVGTTFGSDVIEDFSRIDRDRIEVQAANRMSDLSFSQEGTTAVIRLNPDSEIRVLNYHIDDFRAADFIF